MNGEGGGQHVTPCLDHHWRGRSPPTNIHSPNNSPPCLSISAIGRFASSIYGIVGRLLTVILLWMLKFRKQSLVNAWPNNSFCPRRSTSTFGLLMWQPDALRRTWRASSKHSLKCDIVYSYMARNSCACYVKKTKKQTLYVSHGFSINVKLRLGYIYIFMPHVCRKLMHKFVNSTKYYL